MLFDQNLKHLSFHYSLPRVWGLCPHTPTTQSYYYYYWKPPSTNPRSAPVNSSGKGWGKSGAARDGKFMGKGWGWESWGGVKSKTGTRNLGIKARWGRKNGLTLEPLLSRQNQFDGY